MDFFLVIKMSGRDYKNLIKQHRDSINSLDSDTLDYKQVSKLIETKTLIKFKSVDYDEQKDLIRERKETANTSFTKVKEIENSSKVKREKFLLKLHSNIWIKEWYKLISQLKSSEQELENYSTLFESNSIDYIDLDSVEDIVDQPGGDSLEQILDSGNQIDDLEHFKQVLSDDRIKFKVKTLCPINDLVEDVKFYLKKRQTSAFHSNEQDSRVAETINSVKEQQKRLIEQLNVDGFRLNQELNEFLEELNQEQIERGIPHEAFELECPNEELKISILQEFIIVDFKYEDKLNQLNESYSK